MSVDDPEQRFLRVAVDHRRRVAARLFRAAQAARDVAGGVDRARRRAVRADAGSSGGRLRRAAGDRRRRRRGGRAQHVVGRRHRRADGAHAPAPGARRPDRAGRSARLRPDAGAARGADACGDDQPARRRAARLHHLLLCRDLHDVAEAADAAQHRHRRRRRRAAAGRRLCGRERRRRARHPVAVRRDLLLDAAAFLGAGAGQERRLRARRRADAAQRQGRGAHPDSRSSSIRSFWRRSA